MSASACVRQRVHDPCAGVTSPLSFEQTLKYDLARERIHKRGDGSEAPP
jgi:hypothetical protein